MDIFDVDTSPIRLCWPRQTFKPNRCPDGPTPSSVMIHDRRASRVRRTCTLYGRPSATGRVDATELCVNRTHHTCPGGRAHTVHVTDADKDAQTRLRDGEGDRLFSRVSTKRHFDVRPPTGVCRPGAVPYDKSGVTRKQAPQFVFPRTNPLTFTDYSSGVVYLGHFIRVPSTAVTAILYLNR